MQSLRSFWSTCWLKLLQKIRIPGCFADQAGLGSLSWKLDSLVCRNEWLLIFEEPIKLHFHALWPVFSLAFIGNAGFNGCFLCFFLPFVGQEVRLDAVNWKKWKKGKSRGGAPNHPPVTLLRLLTPRKTRCRSVKVQPFQILHHSLQSKNQS